ncbi:LysR family transcriptional regulator [Kitasatospora sp. NPDC007106]|uniref:LysR family transcriptional regulator n=1 Tax=Kitasatospora sp. NPDC007106 TaxID=3156914 RepID=UPI0033C879CE
MELQHLRAFREVARASSFTLAARNLHCAQSTVTGQIKSLERALGVVLFHRRGRCPIELTEAGELLLTRTEEILRSVELTSQEVRRVQELRRSARPYRKAGSPARDRAALAPARELTAV